MTSITGRRLPDTPRDSFPLAYDDLREGDIWRVLNVGTGEPAVADSPTNLTGGVWMFLSPGGAGFGTLVHHTVREHEDGTVSIRPGDGSSNSILQTSGRGVTWHGYVEHNVWTPC